MNSSPSDLAILKARIQAVTKLVNAIVSAVIEFKSDWDKTNVIPEPEREMEVHSLAVGS